MGGIEVDSDIPEGMEFIPSSVPDGEYDFIVASTGPGVYYLIETRYYCIKCSPLTANLNFVIVCTF